LAHSERSEANRTPGRTASDDNVKQKDMMQDARKRKMLCDIKARKTKTQEERRKKERVALQLPAGNDAEVRHDESE
jgi:hypothetical protein